MKKSLIIMAISSLWLLTGCGHPAATTHPNVTLGLLWDHHVYVLNQTTIGKVGKQLGTVQKHIDGNLPLDASEAVSNEFPVGTKIYEVPGKSVAEAIGVRNPNGQYVEIEADPHSN